MEEKVIEYVRKNPILWNKRYRNRNTKLKDSKWFEIAEELQMSVDTIKKRWKTIRDRYFRIRKLEDCQGKYFCKYKYSKMLEFLNYNRTYNKSKIPVKSSSSVNNYSDDSNSYMNCNELLTETTERCLKYEFINAAEDLRLEKNDHSLTMECLENDIEDDEIIQNTTKRQLYDSLENNAQDDPISHPTFKRELHDSDIRNELKNNNNYNNSAAHLFMMSLALQIEKANLSTESFLNLQIKMLELVKEEIKH